MNSASRTTNTSGSARSWAGAPTDAELAMYPVPERALLVQVLRCASALLRRDHHRSRCAPECWLPASVRTPVSSTSATVKLSRSRSSPTTTRPTSSAKNYGGGSHRVGGTSMTSWLWAPAPSRSGADQLRFGGRRTRHAPRARRRGARRRRLRQLVWFRPTSAARQSFDPSYAGNPRSTRAVRGRAAQGGSAPRSPRVRATDHPVRRLHGLRWYRRGLGAGLRHVRWRRDWPAARSCRASRWATRSRRKVLIECCPSCTRPAWWSASRISAARIVLRHI